MTTCGLHEHRNTNHPENISENANDCGTEEQSTQGEEWSP